MTLLHFNDTFGPRFELRADDGRVVVLTAGDTHLQPVRDWLKWIRIPQVTIDRLVAQARSQTGTPVEF